MKLRQLIPLALRVRLRPWYNRAVIAWDGAIVTVLWTVMLVVWSAGRVARFLLRR